MAELGIAVKAPDVISGGTVEGTVFIKISGEMDDALSLNLTFSGK
jgi:hypothetical protein